MFNNFFSRFSQLWQTSGKQIAGLDYLPFFPSNKFNDYAEYAMKLQVALKNPFVMLVVALQSNIFSLGEWVVKDKDGNILEDDPFLDWINSPNPLQTGNQLVWDYMFWLTLGNSYMFLEGNLERATGLKSYFLNPGKMEFPADFLQKSDYLIISNASEKAYFNTKIKYRYDDGNYINIPYGQILPFHDLSNGITSWHKAPSRIEALYKVISNSELGLDAKNINLLFAKQFMVAGKTDVANTTAPMLQPKEKSDIEDILKDGKNVHAVRSMIDIKRFVEDLRKLELDKATIQDLKTICNVFNIPKEVIGIDTATYENQEKAIARHIVYTMSPKGNDLAKTLTKELGYVEQGKKITFEFDHLPLMKIFEREKHDDFKAKLEALEKMIQMGVDRNDAMSQLGLTLNFTSNGKGENTETD